MRYLPLLTKISQKFTELSVESRLALNHEDQMLIRSESNPDNDIQKKGAAEKKVANIDREMSVLRKNFKDIILNSLDAARAV